jgi:hypothetical protein
MAKKYSTEQLLGKFEDRREVQNLIGRVAAHYVTKEDAKIYADFWSDREDVCLGVNQGYYQGKAAVQGYYEALGEQIAFESKLLQKVFPKQLGELSDEELYGAGMMTYKPFENPIIEIADDGETAKGMWYLRGSYSRLTTSGPVSYYEWGWYCVDFVREADEWKIWHLLAVNDIDYPCGFNWSEPWKGYPPLSGFETAQFKLPEPNVKQTVRALYSADRPFTKLPPMPEPYETFAETFSYGI